MTTAKKALEALAAKLEARADQEKIWWNLSSEDTNDHLLKSEIFEELSVDIKGIANVL